MGINNFFRLVFSMLYRRRYLHLIEAVVVCLSVFIFMHTISMYYLTYEGVLSTKKLIDKPLDQVYVVQFGNYINYSIEDSDLICRFTNDLVEQDFDGVGRYFYMDCGLTNEAGKAYNMPVLFMDNTLMPIADVRSVSGNRLNLKSEQYVGMAVGYEYRERFPLGSLWYDAYDDVTFEVTDYIARDEQWFCDLMVNGSGMQSLNYAVIADVSEQVCTVFMVGFVFANTVLVASDNLTQEQISERLRIMGEQYDLPVFVNSLQESVDIYKSQNSVLFHKTNLQIVTFLTMSLIGLYLLALLGFELQKKTIGIMGIYGVSCGQAMRLLGAVQAITYAFGVITAFWINSNWENGWAFRLDEVELRNLSMVCLCFVAICFVAHCSVLFRRTKKLYRRGVKYD